MKDVLRLAKNFFYKSNKTLIIFYCFIIDPVVYNAHNRLSLMAIVIKKLTNCNLESPFICMKSIQTC